MNPHRHITLAAAAGLTASLWLLSGCKHGDTPAAAGTTTADQQASQRSVLVGTRIIVALDGNVSSEIANVGDVWHGTVTENVRVQGDGEIPPGSEVDGVVTAVTPAQRGSRAMLQLGIRSIRVDGYDEAIAARAVPVIAGSTRKRNVGAVAGGALAGALIGKVVGDGHNAVVGGLIGGAAAAGVVAESKGFQVVLSDGTVMNFTVSRTMALR